MENYGLYRGVQAFDLAPRTKYRKRRPVILFGGMNGAGKTTLLDAIRLCLYGRTSLGARVRQEDYHNFLRERIHHGNGLLQSPTGASVSIEFEFSTGGEQHIFEVKRGWSANGNGRVDESFYLTKNGQPLDELAAEHWEDFVQDLIPPGLSQLFFFDGEKIKRLAEQPDNAELADSIKSLLGLDMVERLSADLSIYEARQRRRHLDADDAKRLGEVEAQIENHESALSALNQGRAQATSRLDHFNAEIERLEQSLARKGGKLAAQREPLHRERDQLAAQIAAVEASIREECEGLFPFALCPKLCTELKEQLEAEAAEVNRHAYEADLRRVQTALKRSLSKSASRKWHLDATRTSDLLRAVDKAFDASLKGGGRSKTPEIIHGVSAADRAQLLAWIDEALTNAPWRMAVRGKELEKLTRRLQKVETALAQAPSDDVLKPIHAEIGQTNQRIGQMTQEIATLDDTIKAEQFQLEKCRREQTRIVGRGTAHSELAGRLDQVTRVQAALGEYLKELTAAKIAELRKSFAECFNRICRKEDLIHRIEVDEKTFDVLLYDRAGRSISKSALSAGEKQIFAVSMLWALARTSGRPLPVIIDTPLARLDSDHRELLLKSYFPHASHQVIILSTDTEVDERFFNTLLPDVSHAYHLKYDHAERWSHADEGYFWKEVDADAATAHQTRPVHS